MDEKIHTLHPQGKKGVNISKAKYDQIAAFILTKLKTHGPMTYEALNDQAEEELKDTFAGSIPWYVVTVKLDLEARSVIERIPKTSPHQLRLAE